MSLRLGLAASVTMLSGCATMFEGTAQSVSVSTNPPGADCVLTRDGARLGDVASTPGSLRVDKSKTDIQVTCKKPGYKDASLAQSSKFVGTTFGNVLLGGVVGVVVDAATGADFSYPDAMRLDMSPEEPTPAASAPKPVS